jgi:small multidrug resistance pump
VTTPRVGDTGRAFLHTFVFTQTEVVVRDLIGDSMPYLLLAGAILTEVLGTTAMKASDGFSRLWPSVWTVVGYLVSFALLAQTLKSMAVGTAYAIWSAVGTALVVAIGVVFFGESTSVVRMLGIALIIGGVVLLNLSGAH